MPPDLMTALLGFALASSITPGPNNFLVMTSGLNRGVAQTLPLIGGISAGFAFMLVAVGTGLGALVQASPALHTGIKAFGLAYMLWLALKVATSAPSLDAARGEARSLSALDGATFQWVNPKAWAIALSATAAFMVPGAAGASLAWIAAVFGISAFFTLSTWAAFGALMRTLLNTPLRMRAFNVVMALLLVASAMPVAYDLLISPRGAA